MFVDGFIATQVSTSKEVLDNLDPKFTLVNNIIYFSLIGLALVLFLFKKLSALKRLLLVILIFMTLVLVDDVRSLMVKLPQEKEGLKILLDAFYIWIFNLVVFAVWYWVLDRGGVEKRLETDRINKQFDLVFPQENLKGWEIWKPGFIDYVFLSFYSSMAFTPTDTLVLSRKMKFLLMMQATISLIILAMIAARAINIIN